MKTANTLLAIIFHLLIVTPLLPAQTSVFSYHGRLSDGGSPATGLYELRFSLYDASTNGSAVGAMVTNSAVAASNGLFIAQLDFGAGVFSGADRWMEIGVRTNGSAGAFQTLAPRQQITSTPYAIRAANFSGAVSDAQLSSNVARLNGANQIFSGTVNFSNASNHFAGSFSGNGAALSGIAFSALQATNRSVIGWPSDAGAALPTGETADVISVKAGSSYSLALRSDGTIQSWGINTVATTVPAGATNVVALAAGGNHALALRSDGRVLAWGINNLGQTNVPAAATNVVAVAAGVSFSLALRSDGTIVAWGQGTSGQTNIPPTATNVVAIGAGSNHGLAVRADGTVVGWGSNSGGQTNPPVSATNVVAVTGGQSFSLALRMNGTIVGWGDNSAGQLAIPPAATNIIAIATSSSSGQAGMALRADGRVLMWGGSNPGLTNVPSAASNVVGIALGAGHALALRAVNGPPLFAFLDRANVFTAGITVPSVSSSASFDLFVGGGRALHFDPDGGNSTAANITGGYPGNSIGAGVSGGNTIAGGGFAGGINSILDNSRGNFIGAGSANTIGLGVNDAVIGGGYGNTINASQGFIGGGYGNIVNGAYGTIPGGYSNYVSTESFAAGYKAQALHANSFVWSDGSSSLPYASTATRQFSVRAINGIRFDGPLVNDMQIGTGAGDYRRLQMGGGNSSGALYGSFPRWGDGLHLSYNYYADSIGGAHILNGGGGTSRISVGYNSIVLATGSTGVQPNFENIQINGTTTSVNGTFNNFSDRNAKQDLKAIVPGQILEKVLQLPVSEWSYKQDAATRHIGPMAQDFHSAFNIGTDEKHIAPIDEGGVALAAIQGLNEKVDAKEQRIRELEKTMRELQELVRALAAEK